jgi:hypothetical protein
MIMFREIAPERAAQEKEEDFRKTGRGKHIREEDRNFRTPAFSEK